MNKLSNLKIVFFGTPDFVVSLFNFLLQNYDLVAVVTAPDKAVGRHQTLTPSVIKQQALLKKIPVLDPEKLDNEVTQKLMNIKPDLFIVASFGKIIPQAILDIPRIGAINIHPSLLPKYRGATPIQTAILNGDQTTGVTIIKMDSQMDHGPIIVQHEYPLSPHSIFQSDVISLFGQSLRLLPVAIEKLVSGSALEEQNHHQATFTKLIKKEDGYFDINNPPAPEVLDRMIRAYYPWPNSWTKWKGKIVKLLPALYKPELGPGDKNYVLVQMEAKKPASLKDFLNGYPDFPIKSLD